MLKFLLTTLCLFIFSLVFSQISYVDMATITGLSTVSVDGDLGGGVSFFDFDGDGWDDLTYAQEEGQDIIFYKNNNGIFIKMDYNISDTNDTKQVNWVDYDNDGDKDFFIANFNAPNRLFNNDGNFVFTEVTSIAGFPTVNKYTYGASWGDYNKDGFLDVFLCSKDILKITPNELYKNNGDGTFTNVSDLAGISNVGHQTFCAAFFDYDNDGDQDIYLANDRTVNTNILYRNNNDGTFSDVSVDSGTNLAFNAMSTTIGDYNRDGWMDIYITNTPEGNALLRNNKDGTFSDVALLSGTIFNSIGWGAIFYDIENDTDIDLYVSGMSDGANGLLPSALYVNDGNENFTIPNDVGLENDNALSFTNACGDFNNDGYMDIAVVNQSPRNTFLWQYDGNTSNNWLKIDLQGVSSNRDGIGSKIEVTIDNVKQYYYTLCGEGYLGQNSQYKIIGLGSNVEIIDEIKIIWLSGVVDVVYNVSSNQTINLVEGENALATANNSFTNFNIYPNPSDGKFKIMGLDSTQPNLNFKVYNALGVEVGNERELINNKVLNLTNLGKGIYFLKLNSSLGSTVKKIIHN